MATEHEAILSEHSTRRARQRGLTETAVDTLVKLADRECHIGGGCRALGLSKQACAELAAAYRQPDLARRLVGVAAVVSADGTVVTVVRHLPGQVGRRYRRQSWQRQGRWAR